MADWRKLAMEAILSDGKIDDNEIKIIKKELYADKKIDQQELRFLTELRNAAQKRLKGEALNPRFESFFFKAVEDFILEDGVITAREARLLESIILADKKVDAGEVKFLTRLKKAAKKTSKEFDALYKKCMGMK